MPRATDVREKIRAFVVATFFVEDFSDEDLFVSAGIIDSMGMVQLVSFLQEQFGIEVREDELVPENLDSLARATAFVERKLDRSAA